MTAALLVSVGAAGALGVLLRPVTAAVAPVDITLKPWHTLRDTAVLCAALLTAWLTSQNPLSTAAAVIALCAVLVATHIDVACRRIPNRLTGGFAVVMAALTGVYVVLGEPLDKILVALALGVAAPVLLFSLSAVYARYTGMAGFGMGDIKLAGPLTYAVAFGGTAPFAVYAYTTFLAAAVMSGFLLLTGRAQHNTRVAFAPYFAVGTVAATVIWPHLG